MTARLYRVLLYSGAIAALAIMGLYASGAWQFVASPGTLSAAHADLACNACHVDVNIGAAALEGACLDCHRDGMGGDRNAHSPAYFGIVGSRDTPWYVSPTTCLDCHRGHQDRRDTRVTSSIPDGFCVACHAQVQERVHGPSFVIDHSSFEFTSCQSCHRYHGRTLFPPHPADSTKPASDADR